MKKNWFPIEPQISSARDLLKRGKGIKKGSGTIYKSWEGHYWTTLSLSLSLFSITPLTPITESSSQLFTQRTNQLSLESEITICQTDGLIITCNHN